MDQPTAVNLAEVIAKQNRIIEIQAEAISDLFSLLIQHITVEEADQLLTDAGVPCGIVCNLTRILNDPNSLEREMVVYTEVPGLGKVPFVGNPLKLETRRIQNRERAPLIGENNEEIFKGMLGVSDEEYSALQEKGVI